jgi:hypothetical protein
MASVAGTTFDTGEESRIILQSLLCLLREKNILSRADIEDLRHRVELRAAGGTADAAFSCCPEAAAAAAEDMKRMTSYLGQRYGGKHARHLG